jgi:DNA-binding MarR family transcriptional regulator
MEHDPIQRVRHFNRSVTRRLGILSDDYLGGGRPWGESRLLFEIGRDGADVRELRARLVLDSGYLSRLLRSLEAQGLVASRPSKNDARVRRVTLTRRGQAEWRLMDARSDDVAQGLLAPLTDAQRARLLAAMGEVEHLLRASNVAIAPADAAGADAQACIAAYVREVEARIGKAFDTTRGPTASPDEFVPPRGVFLLARLEGAAVGCIGLKAIAPEVGEIKRMWVDPRMRGLSIARRLLAAVEEHGTAMGLRTLRLDTNASQVEAIALYERSGYRKIAAYNDNPYADLWFEKPLDAPAAGRAGAKRNARH